ncbi:MAG: hypothetical protein IJV04_07135, partial [Lachnospiraceae bacterium]|nr:hypothetical protein [Lachnospiraceae bacterium]
MRVTNTMISENAMTYIGANKVSVDANNTRMTTQKKIDRPSEDPVIAVRSLRLQTSLDKINQFYEKNIPDAESWMDVTETALLNIKDIMTDVRTLCVQGATDTLTEDDRKTIYTQLKSLQEQLFKEGNADYAGRTVFTGFRTNKDLVFSKDEAKTSYSGIQQPFNAVDMELTRYYTNKVTIPTNKDEVLQLDAAGSGKVSEEMTIQESDYYKLDLAYNLPNEEKDAVTGMHFYDVVTENGKDMWIEQGEITFDTEKRTITGTDPVRSYTMTDLTVTPDKPEQPEYTGMEKPTMPVLPENATDAQKEQYQQDLAKYQSDMVQYKAEYAQYEKQVADYYEKLDNYNSNVMARKYVTDKFGSNLTKIYEFESEADWAAWSKLQQVETAVTDENGDPVMEPVYEDDGVTQKLDEDGNPIYRQVTEMKAMDRKYVPDDAIVIIKDIGDVLSGEKAAVSMMDERAHLSFDYDKTGFLNGEL